MVGVGVSSTRQHQFESVLASRDNIGQAKGILMERFQIDAIRAFELRRPELGLVRARDGWR